MCLAMEKRVKKERIIGAMEYMKDEGKTEKDIMDRIMEKYDVTSEYVKELLMPQKV